MDGRDVMNGLYSMITKILLILTVTCFTSMLCSESQYLKYKDPIQPLHVRIGDLMKRMTLEEKIGQMMQLDRGGATPEILRRYSIGSVLSGGGSVPRIGGTAEEWIGMINGFQNGSLSSHLGIPIMYGIDALHGNNNVFKATIFPHNVALGCTR